MAIVQIPTWPDPYYLQKVRLDGRDFVLHFAFNQREDRWSLDIHDDEDEPIVQGLKLLANWPLLRHYRWNESLPPGELIVMDLTGDGAPPGLDELGDGKRCQLIYQATT
jgi:hypothetical protein